MSHISKKSLINEEIKAQEVRVVDASGEQLGIMKIADALAASLERGMDLVEIAPDAVPPVCKIMDFGKYRFEKEKKEKEIKKKKQVVEIKEIQLRLRIGDHDLQTKLKAAKKFIGDGNKVKVIIKFMGRELTRPEYGTELLNRFLEGCGDICAVEKQPLLDGRNMIMIIAPKKASSAQKGKEENNNG